MQPIVTLRPFKSVIFTLMVAFISMSGMAKNCLAQSKAQPSWLPDQLCVQQYENAGKNCASQSRSMPTIQQCIQTNITAECANQFKIAQNRMGQIAPKCMEANQKFIQKLMAACGIGANANDACHKKYRLEFETEIQKECGGMQ